jgi:hypothetical protein
MKEQKVVEPGLFTYLGGGRGRSLGYPYLSDVQLHLPIEISPLRSIPRKEQIIMSLLQQKMET